MADTAVGSAKGKDEAFLSELLTGDFGTDRLDYLLRDSYHLGVSYGTFDIQRLLNTFLLRYNEDEMGPELAIEDGGIHSVEGFLLARYFMFLDVYFHKTRHTLDLHLTEFLRKLLPNGRYPKAIGEFLRWDDTKALSLFACHAEDLLFSRLFGRAHFRLASETSDHPEKEEVERFDWLCAELERRYGSYALRFDEAQKTPLQLRKAAALGSVEREIRPHRKAVPIGAEPAAHPENARVCRTGVEGGGKRSLRGVPARA